MFINAINFENWLIANKEKITHFRPKKWCKIEMLLPYNRREKTPLIDCPEIIQDNPENFELIKKVLGNGFIEDRRD